MSEIAVLAWLEQSTGGRVPISGTCSIGRLSSNSIVVADERVSRRHALINVQGRNEFWLVDLGSGNGTYLNGRRVAQPTRLKDGDKIEIAAQQLLFHQATETAVPAETSQSDSGEEKTLQQIKSTQCWLLVADIEDSTRLMHQVADGSTALVTGKWLNDCKELVEHCGGSINKFLGDGFFAYWRQDAVSGAKVARALQSLAQMQAAMNPVFRVVTHVGEVFTGGAGSLGEENLQGKEVHFVFRMEKLAGAIGESCLLSEAARNALQPELSLSEAGRHPLPGFEGEHLFYSLRCAR